jgi:hypothetical protein
MPPWLAPLVLLLLALADRLQPAEGRFKMSMAGAGRKSDPAAPPPPRKLAERRLQDVDCEAMIAAVDAACVADVCSNDCGIKLYEATSTGMTSSAAGGCQSQTIAYDLAAAGTFLISAGYTYDAGWTTFQVGIAQMSTVKNAANCIPPCEATPCEHGAVCAGVKTPGLGFTGFTCDCTTPSALGWAGDTCEVSCKHGKVDRTEAIASIDHTIHSVTIAAENPGIHVGMTVTLTHAPGKTCGSAVADKMDVTGIAAGTQIQFAAGSITTTDTEAAENCVLLLECTPCGDGEEPDDAYQTCLPCRPGTFGTEGVCDPCAPGLQPKATATCVDVCLVQTTLEECNIKTNAGAECLWDEAALTCAKDPDANEPCAAADVSAGDPADMKTLCEVSTGTGHCHYLASLASCEPCPDINPGSGLASYSTVGICEACPLGMRPNDARSACVYLADLYADPPQGAIFPRTEVTYSSTATFVGDFAPLLVGPVFEGISGISEATLETETVFGDFEQSSVFALNFESTDEVDGPMSKLHLDTANGAAMLAATLAGTLSVNPDEVRVLEIDIYGEEAFVPPPSGLVPAVLDPSPEVATVTLAGDIASVGVEGSSARSTFVRDVTNALAVTAGVAPGRITIVRIQAASIELLITIADDATDLNEGDDGNAKTAEAAMLSLYQLAVNGDLIVAGYPVISAAPIDYGDTACSAIGSEATGYMAQCASGACVADTSDCPEEEQEEEQEEGRRRRLQTTVPITVAYEVNSTGANIVPLLNDPDLGATFAQVMADGPGMDLEVIFTGTCHSIAERDFAGTSDAKVAVTCSPSAVCEKVTDCVYTKFEGNTLPDTVVPLGFESGSTVRPVVQPDAAVVFDVNSAFAEVEAACTGSNDGTGTACALNSDSTACNVQGGNCQFTRAQDGIPPAADADATQLALEKCMTMCIEHPGCTAITHAPCDEAPCSTAPDNNRGCRFYAGAPVVCVPEVVPESPTCERPDAWCSETGRTYTQGDCDGDGFADHLCVDDSDPDNVRGTLLSAGGCADNWPNAPLATECPRTVLPATGYATLGNLAEDEGSQVSSNAEHAGVTMSECTFLCDTNAECNSFNYDPVDSSCVLMDKVTTASDAVASDADAAGRVTYYKAASCIAGVAEAPNVDLEAAAIEESRADDEHASYDTNLYLLRNIWTPDITLQRKRFTVTDVGLAPGLIPQVTTVVPYEINTVMNGEDTTGVASAANFLGNVTLLGPIIDSSGAVIVNDDGDEQRLMELVSAESVTTSDRISCPAGQWSKDPFCYECTVCQPGQKRVAACSQYADTVCETCANDEYSLYGTECLKCDTACKGGLQFEHTPCTRTTNRVCGTCDDGSVGVRLCSHKSISRSFRSKKDKLSTGHTPHDNTQGVFECPWTCIGGEKPKLHRNEGNPALRFADGRAGPSRSNVGGVEAWVCKGREAQGQMYYGVRSEGKICAPQKSAAGETFSSLGDYPGSTAMQIAAMASDGNGWSSSSCACIESAPVAWWGTRLKKGRTTNPAMYIYARGDCCANALPGEAAQAMTVHIGDTDDFSAATVCGSFDPDGRDGLVVGNVECIGSGSYVFVSAAAGKLSLTEVKVYDMVNMDVGIGHPREFVPRSERDAIVESTDDPNLGGVLMNSGGAWIDDSPNGISSRIGTYALGVTPHAPFYTRFNDEFQSTGEQHVSQMSYLVGDEYYNGAGGDGSGPGGTAGTPERLYGGSSGLIDDGNAVPFNNRRVYVGTHLSSGDGSLLLEAVEGGLTRLNDGQGTENSETSLGRTSADGCQDDDGTGDEHGVGCGLSTGGEGGGRTSRYWTVGSEYSEHGSLYREHWTGMTLGDVEILDDYTVNNPFSAPGEECTLRAEHYDGDTPMYDCSVGYTPGTIEEPSTTCPCTLKRCGDGLNDRDPNGALCRLNEEETACAVEGGGCSFTPCECTFKPATPGSDGPMTAQQAYYASQGQRVDSVYQTIETPWIYVEQWGWAQDRTWFARNVRRGPLTDGRRRRATQEEPGANETEAAVEAQAQNNTELLLPVHELEEIAFAQDDEGDSSSSSGSR